ncbi:aldehyde dehydrogenase family protein [Amycolatopsis sp.]|uniref:aldehyde dehydrogenase family protein n=1 Tax=Amycolatopsis sp. TaxID=37632 RepID=UPI002CECFC9C|nr:aldehyde dehydrogenase family protein [Amycolatopsis sp.]HVV11879.1 aldehyde dehydrogenase family protein [Amycolatopsis sp.]
MTTITDPQERRLLVGGRLVEADTTIAVENPATGENAGDCPVASPALLDEAVDGAVHAGRAWAADPDGRRRALEAVAGVLVDNADLLARTLSLETGLPINDAGFEVAAAAGFARYRASVPLPVDVIHDDGRQRVHVHRAPIGVVAAIIPWNAPIMIAAEKISTSLAAGNTVVLKPSPLAPLATVLLGKLLADVLPPGVLNVVVGGDDLGAALVAHPGVGMVSFTGSTGAGRAIMAAAAPRLKRLSLELGGNDAAIVLPDVAVETVAAKIFMGAFYRGGQVCAAIKRLYVHDDVVEQLVGALTRLAEATIVGDPLDPATTMGPIANRPQFERVRALVDSAAASGGTLVTGGEPSPGPGLFYPPTLVLGLDPGADLVAQEQFGPALPVLSFSDVDEAVEAANATDFGLGASVWTSDVGAGTAIAARLDAGSAWVNRHALVVPDVPFGGTKQSGVGRANGAVGLDTYCELRTVSVALPRRK